MTGKRATSMSEATLAAPWAEAVPGAPYPMSQEDFNRWPDDGWRYELVRGHLVRMPMNSGGHSFIAIKLAVAFVAQCGHLGYGLGADVGFILDVPGKEEPVRLSPDACFVRRERAPAESDYKAFFAPWRVAPDIVAEIVSTNDKAKGVNDKARLWLAGGVKLVWILWPALRRVDVWRPGDTAPSDTLGMADALDGGSVAPFVLLVREVF
jgi:Uma2 family endonuclease